MTTKSEIFFVIDSLLLGGAERVLVNLAQSLCDTGYKCSIVTFDTYSSPSFYSVDHRIGRIHLGDYEPNVVLDRKSTYLHFLFSSLSRMKRLRKIMRGRKNTVFISFMTHVNLVVLAAGLFEPTPIVVSERSCPQFSAGPLGKFLRGLLYLRANKIILQTKDSQKYLPFFLSPLVRIIPNPVKNIPPLPLSSQEKKSEPTILSAGRLIQSKRLDRLFRVFAKLKKKHASLKLVIAGDGPEKEHLNALATELGIIQDVSFVGSVQDLSSFYRSADIFCLSSDYEGFPNALCEAMSYGLPVVSTNCPTGPSEIIENGQSGFLVDRNNEDEFAERVDQLITNSELSKAIGLNASLITQKYSIERITKLWDTTISEIETNQQP